MPGDREWIAERYLDFTHNAQDIIFMREICSEKRECIAADTCNRIAIPHDADKALTHGFHHRVASDLPDDIVDLELVDIYNQDSERTVTPA
jgi:hypothetical protein